MVARRVIVAVAALGAAVLAGAVASALLHPSGAGESCDNLAGECVRARQYWTVRGTGFAALVLAAMCSGVALLVLWQRPRWWQAPIVIAAVALFVAVQATDPVHHLDNRYEGWLSTTVGR